MCLTCSVDDAPASIDEALDWRLNPLTVEIHREWDRWEQQLMLCWHDDEFDFERDSLAAQYREQWAREDALHEELSWWEDYLYSLCAVPAEPELEPEPAYSHHAAPRRTSSRQWYVRHGRLVPRGKHKQSRARDREERLHTMLCFRSDREKAAHGNPMAELPDDCEWRRGW